MAQFQDVNQRTLKGEINQVPYEGRKDGIIAGRKEAKQKILLANREHNRKMRKLDKGNSTG